MFKCQVDIWKSLASVEKFIRWLDDNKVFLEKVTFLWKENDSLIMPCISRQFVKFPEKLRFFFAILLSEKKRKRK